MGREIKRVPLDFDWPLNKTWEGFLNPHYKQCRWCLGEGETDEGFQLVVLLELDLCSSDNLGFLVQLRDGGSDLLSEIRAVELDYPEGEVDRLTLRIALRKGTVDLYGLQPVR